MPEFVGSYRVIKAGHKTQVKSDIKPFIKNAKVAPWLYAIQYIGEDGKPACMLMTEAAFKTGKVVGASSRVDDNPNLGKLVKSGFKYTIELYDEKEDFNQLYEFFANTIKQAIERAKKHPNLCTEIPAPAPKKGLFARLFSK